MYYVIVDKKTKLVYAGLNDDGHVVWREDKEKGWKFGNEGAAGICLSVIESITGVDMTTKEVQDQYS